MSSFLEIITKLGKKQESRVNSQEKRIQTGPKDAQTLDSSDKDFKSVVLNTLKELKETIDKKLKERRMMS